MWQLSSARLQRGGVDILRDLDLTLAAGERVALLGASGAGKSTLLGALRQRYPDAVAWCPQDTGLVPALSTFHNIYMGRLASYSALRNLRNLVWPAAAELAQVAELAQSLGIAGKLRTSVDQLSGGQAQRTALARALYSGRPLLLADEPVSSVDEHQARRLLDLALSRHDAALVALHDRTLALDCFTRVIGLKDGRIALDAPSAALTLADLDALYP